jgi:hypothetical protein
LYTLAESYDGVLERRQGWVPTSFALKLTVDLSKLQAFYLKKAALEEVLLPRDFLRNKPIVLPSPFKPTGERIFVPYPIKKQSPYGFMSGVDRFVMPKHSGYTSMHTYQIDSLGVPSASRNMLMPSFDARMSPPHVLPSLRFKAGAPFSAVRTYSSSPPLLWSSELFAPTAPRLYPNVFGASAGESISAAAFGRARVNATETYLAKAGKSTLSNL